MLKSGLNVRNNLVKERKIKLVWAFLIMLTAFPVTGLICAIVYQDATMFYWSLVFTLFAAVVFPIAALIAPFVWQPLMIVGIIASLFEKIKRHKK